jgi:hypothetical protein
LAAFAAAQTKTSGTGKCAEKPDMQQAMEVGDRTGHSLMIAKESCTWTAPMEIAGVKSKTYTVFVTSDQSGVKSQDRGYVRIVMENGDQAFVRFQGASMSTKEGAPQSGEGTWTYTGGTGKLKGITGKGTYKSKGSEDQIDGEYTLPAGK